MNKTNLMLTAVVLIAVIGLAFATRMQQDNGDSIDAIADRIEIEQLTTTYAWSIDRKDTDALLSIFIDGEPELSEIYPVYDISPLNIPGLDKMKGVTAVRKFLEEGVIPAEPWTFSSISNVEIKLEGKGKASGGDYYIHEGFIPAKIVDGKVVKIYNQFNPDTYDLLCKPRHLVRSYKIGQHLYKFVKDANDRWKVQEMLSSPVFAAENEIISVAQISSAKKPWNNLFNEMADCE